jgi:hypothetical protein
MKQTFASADMKDIDILRVLDLALWILDAMARVDIHVYDPLE